MLHRDPDTFEVQNPISIGIIGGGQLGKMISQEAKRMSFKVIVLDPLRECPAATIVDEQIVADFRDQKAIENLASKCHVLTYEIELANSSVLKELEISKHEIHPSANILYIIQDKYRQKNYLKRRKIPLAEFDLIDGRKSLKRLATRYGLPLLVKACEDSYDGRGNILIHSEEDLLEWYDHINGRKYMVERLINFRKELSVMVARSKSGQIESFPVVENIHNNNILEATIAPARVSRSIRQKATKIAEKTVCALGGSGIFGIEMFLTADDRLLVNEVSPRPHNSGHYTIEACSVSQFEQHLRAISNLPLSRPKLLSPAVMVNILGSADCNGPYRIKGLKKFCLIQGAKLYLYGKRISKPNRKLGHITVTADTTYAALQRAKQARKALTLESM
jgi:5-(carboxyamino)imidazole ribonucleotide synthase